MSDLIRNTENRFFCEESHLIGSVGQVGAYLVICLLVSPQKHMIVSCGCFLMLFCQGNLNEHQ